jgi:hypothetical protein
MADRLDAEPMPPLAIGGDEGMLNAVRLLGQIAPHIGGAYSVTLYDDEVRVQGRAEDVAHIPAQLLLTHHDGGGRDGEGHHYETWSALRDGITITLVSVRRIQQQDVA